MYEANSLPIVNIPKRITSFVIDDLVVTLFFMIIFSEQIAVLFASVSEVNEESMLLMNNFVAENILIIFSIKVLYHTVLIWQNGMTLGKYIMKIRVVDLESGYTPNLQQAFLRAAVRIVSETFFYLGFVMAFFTPLKQTLHDKISKCVVIDA
jgi:uncharacterized RDD family membrane protein YckC